MTTDIAPEKNHGYIVATFGGARLIEINKRRLKVSGGTVGERLEAIEWVSLFMPEAVVSRE